MTDTKFWWQDPDVDFAKVTYVTLAGYTTQAYIDLRTGRGDNKHTDEPVHVKWNDELERWEEQEERNEQVQANTA